MGEVFRFVWQWPNLRAIILMAMISNFMTIPAMSFLPLIVTEYFDGGVIEVGWMSTVQGIGLLSGGLMRAVWNGFKKGILSILPAVILMGFDMRIIGLSPANFSFWDCWENFLSDGACI